MTPYKNVTTGEFRLVDETNSEAVAAAEADGFTVFVPHPDSTLPMPYAAGQRLMPHQVGNVNDPLR